MEPGDWVQVRSAGTMGNGVFATRDIPQGTRIISETPILMISASDEVHMERAFCAAWHNLYVEERTKLDQLSYVPSLVAQANRDAIRQWYKDNRITASDGQVLRGKRLQDASKAMAKRLVIFITNRVQMGHSPVPRTGLFPWYSRFNHSCIPNSYHSYNPTIGRLTIHSTRDVRAGEQLFVSYIDGACRTASERQAELDTWGFECTCEACTIKSNDVIRRRVFDIERDLAAAAYELPLARWASRSDSFALEMAKTMPAKKKEALSLAVELANLLQQQGLEGMNLCRAYV